MKRILLSLVITLGLSASVSPMAYADTVTFPCGPNGETYSVIMPAGVATAGTKCTSALIIDPSVKIIDSSAFAYSQLISVTIPNSVITIGIRAFEGDQRLETVLIGNSVTTIGDGAFANTGLGSVTIPNSVTTIGNQAFYATGLGSVLIGNSVITIGGGAFQYTYLTSVTIPNSVITIGIRAFATNSRLTTVLIGNSVTTIGDAAFAYSQLTSVTIPNSVTAIGEYAFQATQLTSVTIPNSVTTIGNQAFSDTPLGSVLIGNSVTTIGAGAFSNTQLTSVTIPNSVTSIRQYAFDGDVYLATISIPDGLQFLGLEVFKRNYSLTRIEYCGKLTGFPINPVCPADRQAVIDKAAAELKAKQEAEAKAAADLKAKQEAEAAKAAAEQNAPVGPTIVNAQILQTDTDWYAKSSPITVKGLIQIPNGVTLTIHPGTVVDFTDGSVTLLGGIVIGSNDSKSITKVTLGDNFISKGVGGTVKIENTEISGTGCLSESWNLSLSIDNSTLDHLWLLCHWGGGDLSINNSVLKYVGGLGVDGDGAMFGTIHEHYLLTNNVFYNKKTFNFPYEYGTVNVGQKRPQVTVTGNVFFNDTVDLELTLPKPNDLSTSTTFKDNLFETPKKLIIPFGTIAGNNYWNSPDETTLRSLATVIDGKTDITRATIDFKPFLTIPPSAPVMYQKLLNEIADAKVAAELKAKQEADAKAAAELKAKQEADAKAAAELKAKQEAEAAKAAAELKAKQEADAKVAAELKAKQEADAKVAAELKAKQEAEAAKAAADAKAAAELKAKQEAEAAKAAAELKAKQEAEAAKAAAELKAKQEADAKAAAEAEDKRIVNDFKDRIIEIVNDLKLRLLALKNISVSDRKKSDQIQREIKASQVSLNQISTVDQGTEIFDKKVSPLEVRVAAIEANYKKTTITCVKGKLTKKVTAVKPVCPSGYKKKA